MLFELVVYRPRGRTPVTEEEVDRVTSQLPHFSKQKLIGEVIHWNYRNEDTGVHFTVRYDPGRKSQTYPDWNDSPLAVILGLGKPAYFGYEAFPSIDIFLKNLNLGALDVQKTAAFKQPAKLTSEQMKASWDKSNVAECSAAIAAKKAVALAPREKMDSFWKYMSSRSSLQESLGPDILVPPINLHRSKDGTVKTSCIWPDAARVVLPEVDFVLVQREEKKLMSKKKVSGAVPYPRISEMLKTRSEERKEPVKHLLFSGPADKDLLESISALALESLDAYPKLTPDEIIDMAK